MAIDVTMNVLRNPDAPAPKFKIAASLHRSVLIQCVFEWQYSIVLLASSIVCVPIQVPQPSSALSTLPTSTHRRSCNRPSTALSTKSRLWKSLFSSAGIRPQSRWCSVRLRATFRFQSAHDNLCTAVLEYSLGLDLPEEVHNDPIIAELSLAGNDILTWANDVYSFPVSGSLNRACRTMILISLFA